MNTNRHECFLRSAAMVEDLAAARGQFVRAATGAAHTVALLLERQQSAATAALLERRTCPDAPRPPKAVSRSACHRSPKYFALLVLFCGRLVFVWFVYFVVKKCLTFSPKPSGRKWWRGSAVAATGTRNWRWPDCCDVMASRAGGDMLRFVVGPCCRAAQTRPRPNPAGVLARVAAKRERPGL